MDVKCDLPIRESFNADCSETSGLSELRVEQTESMSIRDDDLIESCAGCVVGDSAYSLEHCAVRDGNRCREQDSSKCDSYDAEDLAEQADQTNNNNIANDDDDGDDDDDDERGIQIAHAALIGIPHATAGMTGEPLPELRNPTSSQSNMTDSLQSESNDKADLDDGIFYDCTAEFDRSPPPQSLISLPPDLLNKAASCASVSDDDKIDLDGLAMMDFSSSDWLYPAAADSTSSSAAQFKLEELFSFPQLHLSIANKTSPPSLLASLSSPVDTDGGLPGNCAGAGAGAGDDGDGGGGGGPLTGNQHSALHSFGRFNSPPPPSAARDRSINQLKSPQKAPRFVTPGLLNFAASPHMAGAPDGASCGARSSAIEPTANHNSGDTPGTVGAARSAPRGSPGAARAHANSLIARGVARPSAVGGAATGVPHSGAVPSGVPHSGAVPSGVPHSGGIPTGVPHSGGAPHSVPQSRAEADTARTVVTIGAPHKAPHPFGAASAAPSRLKASVLSGEIASPAGVSPGVPRVTQIVRLGGPSEVAPHTAAIPQKMPFSRPTRPPQEKLVEPPRLVPADTRQIRPPGTVAKAASAVPKAVARHVAPVSADQLDSSRIRQNLLLRGDQARRHTIIDVVPIATSGVMAVAGGEGALVVTPGVRRRIARPTSLVKPLSKPVCSNNNIPTGAGNHDNNVNCCLSPSDTARAALAPQSTIPKPSVGPPIPSNNVPTMTTSVAMTPSAAIAAAAAASTGQRDNSASWSSSSSSSSVPQQQQQQQQPQLQPLNRTFDRDQFRVLKSFTNTVVNDNVSSNSGSDASTDTLRSSSDSENNNSHPLLLTTMRAVTTAVAHSNSIGFQRKLALLPNPSQNEPGIYQLARREEENLKKHVRSSLVTRQHAPAQPQPPQPPPSSSSSSSSMSSRLALSKTSPVRPRGIPTLRK